MDRNALDTQIQEYAHRTFTSAELDGFVEKAYAYLNLELRLPQMEDVENITVTAGAGNLPTALIEFRAVLAPRPTGGFYELPRVDENTFGLYTNAGQHPLVYAINGQQFRWAPDVDGTATAFYYKRQPVATGASTDVFLSDYPDMVLQACLEQVHRLEHNYELASAAGVNWKAYAKMANAEAERDRQGPNVRPRRFYRGPHLARAT